jgi:hypothetical protein
MKYEDIPVKTFLRYALCNCGGRLKGIPGSTMLLSDPPQFLHKCQKCGEHSYLREPDRSPAIVTVEGE